MLWAELFTERIFRFVKITLHGGAPSTETADAKVVIQADVPLPDASEFRTALAGAYGRAVESKTNLTVQYIDVPDCPPDRQEEIGNFLCSVTKKHGNVFLYSPTCFASILRKMGAGEAALFSVGVVNQLRINFPEIKVRMNIAAYPEHVKNLGEFEARAPGCPRSQEHGERSSR